MARPLKFPNLLNGGGEFKRDHHRLVFEDFYNKSEASGHICWGAPPQINQAHRVVYIYAFIMARSLTFPILLNGGGEFKSIRVERGPVTYYEGLTP